MITLLIALMAATPDCPIQLTDVAKEARLVFLHERGGTAEHRLPETMGSGIAWLDYDADGWMDVYVVQSGPFPPANSPKAADRLFRNKGDGTFSDVTAKAGLSDTAYGMGAYAADYDNDGFVDLLVTNWGSVILYRNQGNGTFRDVTAKLGLSEKGWSRRPPGRTWTGTTCSISCSTRYVDDSQEAKLFCGNVETGARDVLPPHAVSRHQAEPLSQRRRRNLPRHHAGGRPGRGGWQGAGCGLRRRGHGRQARPLRRQRRAAELPLPQPGRRALRGHLRDLRDGLRSQGQPPRQHGCRRRRPRRRRPARPGRLQLRGRAQRVLPQPRLRPVRGPLGRLGLRAASGRATRASG